MRSRTLFERIQVIQFARNYCLLNGLDPDEVTTGYFVDTNGCRQRVSKARWRWYQDIGSPEPAPTEPDTSPSD